MSARAMLIALVVAILAVLLGVRAIDRIGYLRSLHDSALETAEHVRRANATLSIELATLHARERAVRAHVDSLQQRTLEADRRIASAEQRAESARAARALVWRSLDSARTAHDSLAPLIAAVAAGDVGAAALRTSLEAAHDAIALRDSTIAAQQQAITLLTTSLDSLEQQRARDAAAREQLVAALRVSAPRCRVLFGLPCPSRAVTAIGAVTLTLLARGH